MSSSGFPRFVVADRGNRRLQMFEVRRHPDSIVIREAWVTALVRAVDLDQLALDYPDWKGSSPPRPGAVACLESGIIAVVDEASPERAGLIPSVANNRGQGGETASRRVSRAPRGYTGYEHISSGRYGETFRF